MAEIILRVLSLTFYVLVWLFLAFTDYLDWHGRMEVLETKHPQIAKLVQSRPLRLVLLLMLLGMIVSDFRETIKQVGTEPLVVKASVPAPASPNVVIYKRIIKTTGSGRLDRDLNDQQSNHLYHQLKSYVDTPNRVRPATVIIANAYPCDRESKHLFWRLNRIFNDAHWTVTQDGGWPMKSLQLQGRTKNQIPIGIWILTDDGYLRYFIWNSLQESGLESDNSFVSELPEGFKGLIVVIGYKDVPF